jgi:hypothetical protein
VPGPAAAFSRADAQDAGAAPRDAIDRCYLEVPAPSFSKVRAAPCAMLVTASEGAAEIGTDLEAHEAEGGGLD